jgi:hypothetical protein
MARFLTYLRTEKRKNAPFFLPHFLLKMMRFTKTGSGKTQGKHSKREAFIDFLTASAVCDNITIPSAGGEKTVLFNHSYINVIFLPRQAWDKHKKTQKKSGIFSGNATIGAKNDRLLRQLPMKRNHAPRQARDKHKQNRLRPRCYSQVSCSLPPWMRLHQQLGLHQQHRWKSVPPQLLLVRKRVFFAPNRSFYQDRLGTNIGKALKTETRFLVDFTAQFDKAASDLEAWWASAFAPNPTGEPRGPGQFSGNFPALETNDTDLSTAYYGGLLSFMVSPPPPPRRPPTR